MPVAPEEVDVTIAVGVPELATRAGETGMNSGLGAIDNFDDDEWTRYDVRYILEVYESTDGFKNHETPIRAREVKTLDKYAETTFNLRLIPNRTYRFVVWADFVNQGSEDDLYYNTADLKAITRLGAAVAMDESQDAYFKKQDILVTPNGINENIELKRPFGKIRVITTDYTQLNYGSKPKEVKVEFYNHQLLTSLNAVTGIASGETTNTYSYAVAKDAPYTKGYDEVDENMTLFADYILAADETIGAREVNFKMTVIGEDDREIFTQDFSTQIPLQRNHLTTIVGNLLTANSDITISIDDDFDGEYIRNWDDEAVQIEDGNWGVGVLNANRNYEFVINDGVNDFTLIVPEDAVNQTTGKLSPVGGAQFVASEAELEKNTFTITGLMVDPTRAAQAATVVDGTMRVSNYNDGVQVQLDLYYSFAPEADPTEYKNLRFEFTGDAVAKTSIEAPVVKAEVEGNVVALTWDAVKNAGTYTVIVANEMPVVVEECEYTFTGEFATEYTISVVAVPADEEKYYTSEATVVTVTTDAEPVALATPVVTAVAKENTVTLTWDAVENAAAYSITVGTEMPVVTEETTYVFTGEYETEYTFNVVAIPADEEKFEASEAGVATATTETAPAVEPTYTTVADFLAADVDNTTFYTLKGTITRVANTTYGNFDLTDETGTIYVYGLYSEDGATNRYWATSGAQLGDDIVISAVRADYNGQAQASSARFLGLTSPGTLAFWSFDATATSFTAAGGDKKIGLDIYNATSEVVATSDNAQFTAAYADGTLTITAAENTAAEDIEGNITVTCGSLSQTIAVSQAAASSGDQTAVEAELVFSAANRTTFTTSQQVFEANGIKVINDKASSSSNVADYVAPARFYKSSKITVTAPGNITAIVFDCNSASYATALQNSGLTGTVSVSSDKVTVTLDGSSNEYVISSLTSGQVRMDSVTVTYLQ